LIRNLAQPDYSPLRGDLKAVQTAALFVERHVLIGQIHQIKKPAQGRLCYLVHPA